MLGAREILGLGGGRITTGLGVLYLGLERECDRGKVKRHIIWPTVCFF